MTAVSIVVPIYNVEQYLERCIDSLLVQTLQDIEIILVNDGSIDESPKICDKYAKKDSRIKVIHKKNGGLSSARNVAIDIAKGEYIAFLDSDDWVEPNFYEYLYNLIRKMNADIAQCNYLEAYTDDEKIEFKGNLKERTYTGLEALYTLYEEKCVKNIVVWNKLYHKSLFQDIRFPEGKIHEDEFTTYKILYRAKKVVDSNIPMIYYRQREGSIMAEDFNEKRLHVLEALKERREYFKKLGLIELIKRTEANICGTLKRFYIQANKSQLKDKKIIMKNIKKDMIAECIGFIFNPYITARGKITLMICIVNGKAFCKMYEKHTKIH